MKSTHNTALFITALVLGGILGWCSLTRGIGYRVESVMLDHWFEARYELFGTQPLDPRLVLVGIDSETIESLGKPMIFWQADLAEIVNKITAGGAAAVGLDLVISPKTKKLSEAVKEQLYIEAMSLGTAAMTESPVILGEMYDVSEYSTSEHGGEKRFGYAPEQVMAPHELVQDLIVPASGSRAKLGLVNVPTDPDGAVRRLQLFEFTEGQSQETQLHNFPLRLLAAATGKPVTYSGLDSEESFLRWGETDIPLLFASSFLINYPGPTEDNVAPGQPQPPRESFPILSAARVLDGTIASSEFKDKIVIVGPTADSLNDVKVVPGDNTYHGPAIHLSVLNTILSEQFLRRSSPVWLITCALLSLIGAMIGRSGKVLGMPLGLTALVAISFLMFAYAHLWLPTVFWSFSFCLGGFLGYLQRMLTVERDRAVVRSTFARMVSPQVMQHVLEDMSVLHKGKRKELTVLFTDINDFTPICEKHEPEEVIQMLSDYFSLMVEVIMKYDGYLKQYVGDEIMVIFGAPDDSQDHATRALLTALEMRDVLAEAKKKAAGKTGFYEVKIGINSGSVVVGKVGPDQRWEYAAVGDSVNLGARVMSVAQKLGMDIGISDATRRRYLEELKEFGSDSDPIVWNSMGVQQFKGKVSQMEVFGIQRKDKT